VTKFSRAAEDVGKVSILFHAGIARRVGTFIVVREGSSIHGTWGSVKAMAAAVNSVKALARTREIRRKVRYAADMTASTPMAMSSVTTVTPSCQAAKDIF
jgi:hypothetical protein